jgi:hypothetical protein
MRKFLILDAVSRAINQTGLMHFTEIQLPILGNALDFEHQPGPTLA